jgi:hypothetical protein
MAIMLELVVPNQRERERGRRELDDGEETR